MKKLKEHLIIIGIAIFLTTILTWPFALNLGSYYTDQGDYSLGGSVLWYNSESLKTGKIFDQKEYFKGYQFYPQPYSLAFANNSITPSLIFTPIYWITDSLPFSVNTYIMLTLVLSFITSFYSVNYFLKNKWAALVGAFIFTFNVQTMVRFPQHLDILGKYFLPLVFLFAYQFLEKPTLKRAVLFFSTFTLNALTVNYYQVFTIVVLPLVALPFLFSSLRKRDWGYFGRLGKWGLIGVVFLPILLYFNLPFLDFSQKEGAFRPLEATTFFSARVNDWFASSPDNFLFGGWVKGMEKFREPKDDRGIINYEEHSLFLGLLPLILFLIGLKAFKKEKINKWYFYILLLVPFILTFGPFVGYKEDGFPLPFYFLYKLVPLMEGIRSPSRFEFLFFIPFSLIASYGALLLIEKKGLWVLGVIGIVLILENFTVKDFSARSQIQNKINQIGKENLSFLEGKATVHLPVYSIQDADEFGRNSTYINWLTQTEEVITNGNTSYLPPDQISFLEQLGNKFDESALLKLSLLKVNYVVIHKDLLPENLLSEYTKILSHRVVFNDRNTLIVDLNEQVLGSANKYSLTAPICILEKDFDIRVTKVLDDDLEDTNGLIIQNKADCFLPSIYEDRYRSIKIEIEGVEREASFRVPILIGPKEQIVVSIAERSLRIK